MRGPVAAIAAIALLAVAPPALAGAAPAPGAARAEELLQKKELDELFLAFGAVKAPQVPKGERGRVAAALEEGARAAAKDGDNALALSLGEKAAEIEASPARSLLVAEISLALDQHGPAAAALDAALKREPANGKVLAARARLHEKEGEPAKALALWKKVPGKAAEAAAAKEGIARCVAELEEQKRAKEAIAKGGSAAPEPARGGGGAVPVERGPGGRGDAGRGPGGDPAGTLAGSDPFQQHDDPTGKGGMRSKGSKHFKIVYSDKGDFGRRADYEYRVLQALERSKTYACQKVGHCPEQAFEVVLYTKEEFDKHFGNSSLGQAAGFFAGKIRINNAEEITQEVEYTLLHEFVHAQIADALGGPQRQIPAWLNEGIASYIERQSRGTGGALFVRERELLRMARKSGRMPRLADIEGSFINLGSGGEIAMAYAIGATAARLLDERRRGRFPELFARVKRGEKLEAALEDIYGWSLPKLQEEIDDALSSS